MVHSSQTDRSEWETVWAHPSMPYQCNMCRKEVPGGWVYRLVDLYDRRGLHQNGMMGLTFVPFPEGHPRPLK